MIAKMRRAVHKHQQGNRTQKNGRQTTLIARRFTLSDYRLLRRSSALNQRHLRANPVMYVNFRKPSIAADSELTDDDVIIRYDDQDEIAGFTILHAEQR